jgi:hypothetical protein
MLATAEELCSAVLPLPSGLIVPPVQRHAVLNPKQLQLLWCHRLQLLATPGPS